MDSWCELSRSGFTDLMSKCTCVQLSSLRGMHINMLQLFVPFLLSFAVGNMLWQNIPKWKQSPLNSPRRVHENRRPKMLTLWMWHLGDVFRARGRGGVGRKNGNTCLYSSRNTESTGLHFANWLSKNWFTDPTGSTHLYSASPWLYICLLPVAQTGQSQCWQHICFQTVPLKDVGIDGLLERLLVPSLVLANTFRDTWVSLGRAGLEWKG